MLQSTGLLITFIGIVLNVKYGTNDKEHKDHYFYGQKWITIIYLILMLLLYIVVLVLFLTKKQGTEPILVLILFVSFCTFIYGLFPKDGYDYSDT